MDATNGSSTSPALPSIAKGIPLADEPGLGALTLPGFLREVTSRHAGNEALVLHTAAGVIRWSYATLWERATEIARALIACGVGKDSRVGVLMTNRPEWIASFFGVGLAGGVPVALSTFSTEPELEHLLKVSSVSTVIVERHVAKKDFVAALERLEPAIRDATPGKLMSSKFPFLRRLVVVDDADVEAGFETWSDFLSHGRDIPLAVIDSTIDATKPSDAGALFLSSGSTNLPKGILSSHRGVAIQCWRMCRVFGFKDDVRTWTANGFIWSGNFALALGGTFAAGGAIILQRIFEPVEALNLIQDERVTWPYAWPHQWEQLVAAPNWETADLSALRYVNPDRPAAQHPTFTAPVWRDPLWSYGSTETFTLSTSYTSDDPPELAGGTNGEVLPGNTLKIVDPDTGAIVPRGERGEIAVKGATLMLGYIGTPLSDTLDDEGFFRTGDGGYMDEAGRLFFEGRLSDIIKTGGANVSPLEVDGVLAGFPGVQAVQTVGMPHKTLGEIVVSCIVPHPDLQIDEGELREFLKQRLASYKQPRRILFVREEDLTLTGSAKIKTSALRELVAKLLDQPA